MRRVRTPLVAQIGLVAMLSTALTYVAAELNYRTGLNVLWMIVLPLIVGLSVNQSVRRKALMATTLVGVSLFAVMTTGWMMGAM